MAVGAVNSVAVNDRQWGDVNGDGNTDMNDALLIRQFKNKTTDAQREALANQHGLTAQEFIGKADTNGDQRITQLDLENFYARLGGEKGNKRAEKGDANGDGKVGPADAGIINSFVEQQGRGNTASMQAIAESCGFSGVNAVSNFIKAADTNGDGRLTELDTINANLKKNKTVKAGDVDGDGINNQLDANRLNNYLGLTTETQRLDFISKFGFNSINDFMKVADTNSDGRLTTLDAENARTGRTTQARAGDVDGNGSVNNADGSLIGTFANAQFCGDTETMNVIAAGCGFSSIDAFIKAGDTNKDGRITHGDAANANAGRSSGVTPTTGNIDGYQGVNGAAINHGAMVNGTYVNTTTDAQVLSNYLLLTTEEDRLEFVSRLGFNSINDFMKIADTNKDNRLDQSDVINIRDHQGKNVEKTKAGDLDKISASTNVINNADGNILRDYLDLNTAEDQLAFVQNQGFRSIADFVKFADTNKDGRLTQLDGLNMNNNLTGTSALKVGDLDGNGKVNNADADIVAGYNNAADKEAYFGSLNHSVFGSNMTQFRYDALIGE